MGAPSLGHSGLINRLEPGYYSGHIFGVGEGFRHYYDHLWYAMAVLAGLFFVADSSAQNDFMDLQEENQNSREASAYLLNQVRDYDRHCQVDLSLGRLHAVGQYEYKGC